MNDTAMLSFFAPCAARRDTFQLAVKPSAEISCLAGRKRPWKEGCGQSARIVTAVSVPEGASAKASEPPSSNVKENSTVSAFASVSPSSGACTPAAVAASPEPGAKPYVLPPNVTPEADRMPSGSAMPSTKRGLYHL